MVRLFQMNGLMMVKQDRIEHLELHALSLLFELKVIAQMEPTRIAES